MDDLQLDDLIDKFDQLLADERKALLQGDMTLIQALVPNKEALVSKLNSSRDLPEARLVPKAAPLPDRR